MAARSHGKTGSKPRAVAQRSARKGAKRNAARGMKRPAGAGGPLTTPTPMETIAPIGGTPPTIDGRA